MLTDDESKSSIGPSPPRAEARALNWRIVGCSVRGANHVRSGDQNQDFVGWTPSPAAEYPLVLAVADGHGSAKCFRSADGSRFAVEVAIEQLLEFGTKQRKAENNKLSVVKDSAIQWLPQQICRQWRRRVQENLAEFPLRQDEIENIDDSEGGAARQCVVDNPFLAYGTTLIAVLVTERFIVFLQVGDGDILTVTGDGEVSWALPTDDRLLANETTSLAAEHAWRDFRVAFRVIVNTAPALIIAATDGCSNSFRSTEGFMQVGADLWAEICANGAEELAEKLQGWLTKWSEEGSGDDVTLGLVCRLDAIEADGREFLARRERDAQAAARTKAVDAEAYSNPNATAPGFAQFKRSVALHNSVPRTSSSRLRRLIRAAQTLAIRLRVVRTLKVAAPVVAGAILLAVATHQWREPPMPPVEIVDYQPKPVVEGRYLTMQFRPVAPDLKLQYRKRGAGQWSSVASPNSFSVAPKDLQRGDLALEFRWVSRTGAQSGILAWSENVRATNAPISNRKPRRKRRPPSSATGLDGATGSAGQGRRSDHDSTAVALDSISDPPIIDPLPAHVTPRIRNTIGMELQLVPSGEFSMGSSDDEPDRSAGEVLHRVRITRPFYLGKFEVTQHEYDTVIRRSPNYVAATAAGADQLADLDAGRNPVEAVTWEQADEFCRLLSAYERSTYRLPTEAEWEYACRSGTTTPFHFGGALNGDQANYDGGKPYGTGVMGLFLNGTCPVGRYPENRFGLYDMHGNVLEWCSDWYGQTYSASPAADPRGPRTGKERVIRGGAYSFPAKDCRSATRYRFASTSPYPGIGFRVLREL
jgi:formylglycine-generating enzyme required for sulfatase activity/serine/threonine protein phosphatase PrpC